MAEGVTERGQLIAATANRLRLVQVDFADQDAQTRQDYLSEEIERALAQVPPEARSGFLGELMERFPAWDANVDVSLKQAEAVERSSTDARELRDPNFLVARLIEVSGSLDAQERKVLSQRLAEANLVPVRTGGLSEEAVDPVRGKLRMKSDEPVDAERLAAMAAAMVEFAAGLDQLGWNTWQKLSPNSQFKRPGELRTQLRKYLSGGSDVGSEQVEDQLARLRQLLAALISAISQAGRQFSSRYLARFAPSEIESLAKMEGGGFLVSQEVRCWRKYTQLAESLNPAAMEQEIMEAISTYAESLMKGIHSR